MALFTLDLFVEFDCVCKIRDTHDAIIAGTLEAHDIAPRLDIDSPPKIILRAHRLNRARESFVLADFAATKFGALLRRCPQGSGSQPMRFAASAQVWNWHFTTSLDVANSVANGWTADVTRTPPLSRS